MKVFVIHYKKMVKRKENMLRQLQKCKITDYEFVDIDRDDIHNYDLSKIDKSIKPALIAIFLSHSHAYKQISKFHEQALVLEDDAIMDDNFMEKFTLYQNQLDPYFDMLFIGSGCNLHIEEHKIVEGKNVYRKYHEPTAWGGAGSTRCVDSYLVSKKCASKLCNYIDKLNTSCLVTCEIDHWLNKVGKELDLLVYWAEPTIVSQGSENNSEDCRCY